MPGIFNLENVATLVEKVHPSRILILDTNIIMNSPEPDEWNVQGQGRNLFVLSDILIQELEFIRRKKVLKEKAESIDSSIKAIKNLANLFNKGKIAEGIKIESGWVISIPTPVLSNGLCEISFD